MALVMLMGLPAEYEPLILSLEHDEDSITVSQVKARLLVEEKRQARRVADRATDQEEEEAKALISKSRITTRDKGGGTTKHNKSIYKKGQCKRSNDVVEKRVRCYACGKFGHIAIDCPPSSVGKSEPGETCSTNTHKAKIAQHRAMSVLKDTHYESDV